MAISITRYVDIVSGVVAAVRVQARELIGRVYTTNPLLPPNTLIEITSAEDAGDYFGYASKEYKRAAYYFGWISKNITRPKKLSFFRWVNAAVAAFIYGGRGTQDLAAWQAITDGSISITMGSNTYVISGLDFSAAASLSAVAAIIQTGVNAASVDVEWANATVTWDSARKQFVLTGGAAGNYGSISAAVGGVGTEILSLIRWSVATGAIYSDSTAAMTVTETLVISADMSNNFGSFCFDPAPTVDEAMEAAVWALNQNIRYMFSLMSTVDGSDTPACDFITAGLGAYPLIFSMNYPGEFIDMFPMMILAATDYTRRASVQNYMYQIDDRLTPTVNTDPYANLADAARLNYYGQTQQAGKKINFYQRGIMWGMPSSPAQANVFANEMWLKDAATVAIMELLLNLARVSANAAGRAKVLNSLQPVIDQGLFNGTISVGKDLSNIQKNYITEQTGDPLAWYQVQTLGYWLDAVIIQVGIEFVVKYTLIYSKDDTVNKVEGSHQLI